ncbi:MAG: amidohydrolase family protein [Pirellula sp.]
MIARWLPSAWNLTHTLAIASIACSGWIAPLSGTAQETKPDLSASNLNAPNLPPSSAEKTPSVVLRSHPREHAAFPVVDVHTHFFAKGRHDPELLDRYVKAMDRNRVAICVSLDGQLGSRLDAHEAFLWKTYRDRFVIFANLDFQGSGQDDRPETWACNQPDFVQRTVEQLRVEASRGRICGLKFFKDFGLRYRNADGSLLQIDDERWDPIWSACGTLGLPVIMHTADPSAFFRPTDASNERALELSAHPDWAFNDERFPTRASLHQARNRILARHPHTQFIAAHFGNDAEDLEELSGWLDTYPNLWVEFSSRINELGRQPYTARRFFETYQDRILFGTDGPFPEERMRIYWRFLETWDEYFLYSEKSPPPQGDWRIYAIGLDAPVLRKIYFENAARLIPGVRERIEKFESQHHRE